MRNEVNRTFMVKKNVLKYLCAFLLLIGACVPAWATVTDTFDDFANCGWGFATGKDFSSGTYTLGKLTLVGENVKANTYSGCESVTLTKANGGGSLTLPSFDGTVSKIKLYTHSSCDGTYDTEVGVYVDGVLKTTITLNRSTLSAQYTFSPVVAKGAVIMLHNESNNALAQLTKIEVTHEGTAISSGANSITKSNVPAEGGTFTCTVGGNEVSSAAKDATVQLTATPNSGYTLLGFVVTGNYSYCSYGTYVPWTEDITVNGSNQFTMPDGNVIVEALWEESTTFTVTYDRSKALCAQNTSGSWPANATGLTSGTVQALPTDIELNGVDGYTFAGWTSESGTYVHGTSPLYTTSVTVTSNITLYPVFSQSGSTGASVTFNAQSGGIATGYYAFCYGQSGTQNAMGSDLNTTTYKLDPVAITVTSSTASVTDRKAMWQIEASSTYWTIKNVYSGKYVALKRDGSNNIQNNKVDMVSSVTNDAKWTFEVQSDHYYIKNAANANYFLRYYGTEKIWNINNGSNPNNNGGSLYMYKSATTPAAATSTYTTTPPCTTYTLTYNANGAASGSVPASATEYASGAVVTVKGNSGELTKAGYDFNGWKADNASNGTAYAAGSSITMNADHTLYAQWTAHTINLVLDANTANGGATDGSATVKYNNTALEAGTVHAIGTTGKTLTGYFSAPTAGTKVLNADGTYAEAAVTDYITSSKWTRDESPTTLHAQWRQNTYTVVFNKNATGPSGSMANQNFTYGTAQDLTTNGYTWPAHNFEGWATEEGSSTVVYGNGAEVNNLTAEDGGTVNLYAVWTDKTYNDYKFTCVDIALTTEDVNPVLVTSRQGINIMAKKKLILTVDGTTGPIDLTSENDVLHFYKKTTSAPIRYVELTGANRLTAPVTEQEVYVSYQPNTVGTGDFEYPSITVAQGANVRHYPGKVQARNLPDDVAIVAKVGGSWFALPANISTAATPEPVPVTVAPDGGILKATGPSTLSYKLWPVATTNSLQDRFGTATGYTPAVLYADRMRFAGNDNKGLWMNNSNSASTIKNDGAITAVGTHFATDAAYEWDVTTTLSDDNFVYNLKAENGSNIYDLRMKQSDFKWGTYANGETNVLYILPLIEKTPAKLTVMEWGTNEIAISYPNGGNATAITAKIDNGATTDVTKTSLGGDMYRLTGVGDLQANPGKTLTLDITESGSPKQLICRIPLIVTTTQNVTDLRELLPGANALEKDKVANVTDVVIRKTGNNIGKLQTAGSSADVKFNNIYVYPAAKLNVTDNTRLSLNHLYLRGGYSFLSAVNSDNYKMPEAYIMAQLTGSANIIYDLYINNSYYYFFALPYTVSLSNVHDETGSDDFKVWVKYYDGAERASGAQVTGWKYYSGTVFTAGVGYEIAAKPRVTGRPLAIVRFPLGNKALTSGGEGAGEGAKEEVAVDNYGYAEYALGTQTANNVGWNFVGNPYMSTWKQTTDWGLSYMQIGSMQENTPDGEHWDGTYVWKDEPVRYVTILNLFAQEYSQQATSNYELPPFQPFFIQVKDHNASFSMSKDNRIAKAPAQMQNIQRDNERLIELILNSNLSQDNTGLLIGEDFSADYEMGDDLVKMTGNNQLAIYTQTGGYDLAFNALSEELAAQRIPVGFTAPADGEYSISINDNSDLRDVESVILTDYETGLEIDLMAEDYIFDAVAQKNNDHRFTLNIRMRNWRDIGTDIDGQHAVGQLDEVRVLRSSTGLVLRNVPLDATVYVYDMTGKLIGTYLPEQTYGQQTDVGHRVELNGLPIGVYNIRVQTATDGKTLRGINN